MIKLVIEIEEKENLENENIQAIRTEINIQEIGRNVTNREKEVSNLLKMRMQVNEKIQIETEGIRNKKRLKEQLEKLLKSL